MVNRFFNANTGGIAYLPAERRPSATTKYEAIELAEMDLCFYGFVMDKEMTTETRHRLLRQVDDASDVFNYFGIELPAWFVALEN